VSGAHATLSFAAAAGGGHQQGEGEIGGRLGQRAGRVADWDAARGCRRQVYVIEADRHLADDLQTRRGSEQGGIHLV